MSKRQSSSESNDIASPKGESNTQRRRYSSPPPPPPPASSSPSSPHLSVYGYVPRDAGPGRLKFHDPSVYASVPPEARLRRLNFDGDKDYFIITEQNSQGEEAKVHKKVHKLDAICGSCSKLFETGDVLKMTCKCKSIYLVHVSCAPQWLQQKSNNKCDDCGEDIQRIEVTLSECPKKDKKNSTPRRSCCCFF